MLLIIGIIICAVTLAFMLMTNNSYNKNTFLIRAITLLVGASIVITSEVVSSEITEQKEEYKLVESQNIVALQDNSNTSGRFLLGSGTVNGSMYILSAIFLSVIIVAGFEFISSTSNPSFFSSVQACVPA